MLRSLLLVSTIVLFAGCASVSGPNGATQAEQKPPADHANPMAPGLDWLHTGFWDNTPKEYHLGRGEIVP
jgi:hypothetical protein